MSFNIILTFRVNCRNILWNLAVILSFRGSSPRFIFGQFYTRFQQNLKIYNVPKIILRDRVPFYQEKETIFEVIFCTFSEFPQIGTPHFSLEGFSLSRFSVTIRCSSRISHKSLLFFGKSDRSLTCSTVMEFEW